MIRQRRPGLPGGRGRATPVTIEALPFASRSALDPTAGRGPTPSRLRDVLALALSAALVVLIGGMASALAFDFAAPRLGAYPMVVVSGSMAPAVPVGSLVIVSPVDPSGLAPGQIVTVRLSSGDVLTHRLVAIEDRPDGRALALKGDANNAADPLPVAASALIGRVETIVPGAGYAFWAMRQPLGLLSFSVLVAGLLLMRRLVRNEGGPGQAWPAGPLGREPTGVAPRIGARARRPSGRTGIVMPGLVAGALVVAAIGWSPLLRTSAVFTDTQPVSGNTFSTITWLMWWGSWDSGTTYPANAVVEYGGSSWIGVNPVAATPPSPSAPLEWALLAAKGDTGSTGSTGSTGATGPGYAATSTTSVAIGTGSKSVTTQAGLAYVANLRVRIANDASNYMEGTVTSYSGTSLVVSVDRIVGSGTFASWTIGLAGDVGAGNTPTGGTAGSASLTSTSTTYAAPSTGTAASNSVTVTGSRTVLVVLTATCSNSTTNNGCYMSFAMSGATTQASSDSFAFGNTRGNGSPGTAGSAVFLVTVNNGTTTFTAQYRANIGATATFLASRIILQVY